MFDDAYTTVIVFGKIFFSDIILHLHKHRINKKIARALLHCKRDGIINYVDIIHEIEKYHLCRHNKKRIC